MSDNAFVPGELPIYEKYSIVRKRTIFELLKIVGAIAAIFADPNRDVPSYWYGVFTELRIRRDKIYFEQYKRNWFLGIPVKHGELKKSIALNAIGSAGIKTLGFIFKYKALCFTMGGQTFELPFDDSFDPESMIYNLKAAGLNVANA